MLTHNTGHIFPLAFKYEKHPVHEVAGNLYNRLLGVHPFTISLIGHRHGRNFPYGYSGRFNNKTTQHGVLADRDAASAVFFPAGVAYED